MTMPGDPHDTLQLAVARLTVLEPSEFHRYQVRRRCHRVLAAHGRPRRPSAWVTVREVILASAVALYVAAAVAQAFQLAGGLS